MPEIKQWEYYIETLGSALKGLSDEEVEAVLNALGEEGWELFSLYQLQNSPKIRITAKRPLTGPTRRRRSWPGD